MKKKESLAYQQLFAKLGLAIVIAMISLSVYVNKSDISIGIMGIIGFIMYIYPELKVIK